MGGSQMLLLGVLQLLLGGMGGSQLLLGVLQLLLNSLQALREAS